MPTSNFFTERSARHPSLLRRQPGKRTRKLGEILWDGYPPLAILAAALIIGTGAGCTKFKVANPFASQAAKNEASASELAAKRRGDNIRMRADGTITDAPPSADEMGPIYPDGQPVAGVAAARAIVRHGRNQIDLINLSNLPWPGGMVWINRQWAINLPYTPPNEIRRLKFEQFKDGNGQPFPTRNLDFRVSDIELQLDDELATVNFGLAY